MNEYLQCLYDYILEVRRNETLLKTAEFRRLHSHLLRAFDVMEAALTREQREIVNDVLSTESNIAVLENEWLFRESVALGKWLAQV